MQNYFVNANSVPSARSVVFRTAIYDQLGGADGRLHLSVLELCVSIGFVRKNRLPRGYASVERVFSGDLEVQTRVGAEPPSSI
jgi:hypothetical protein